MKTQSLILILLACMATAMHAQVYNQIDETGMITQRDESNGNFNPNRRDSVQNKEIPRGVRVWTIDRRFGDVRPAGWTLCHTSIQTLFSTRESMENTTQRVITTRPA